MTAPAAAAADGHPAVAPGTVSGARTYPDHLVVTDDDGHGWVSRHTLRCHPEGGSHPHAWHACHRLDEMHGPAGPVPPGRMCSMLYGGPQTARVDGVWHGRPVHETYSRKDGCQTERWRRMVPVLPDPSAPIECPEERGAKGPGARPATEAAHRGSSRSAALTPQAPPAQASSTQAPGAAPGLGLSADSAVGYAFAPDQDLGGDSDRDSGGNSD